ncbi:rhodanese-like domain-containing protein [Candidatus Kaiserbacteria bacterium]|nr:rhodanese-like domain-containing protein [Candidatus Kaiserbacteria bacterium]
MIDVEKITNEVASEGAILFDVRRDEEWNTGHPAPAQRFEYERFENGEFPQVPKDTRIYLCCNSGGRAGRAKTLLEDAGFTNVENAQGIVQWREAGGDVTTP